MNRYLRGFLIVASTFPVLLSPVHARQKASPVIKPVVKTQSVTTDPDDPAIWLHPTDRERSLVFGTNKSVAKEGGAMYVFSLNGKVKQVLGNLDRPNNVDVEYGFRLNNTQKTDIAVVTERGRRKLHLYYINSRTGSLKESGNGVSVFEGETNESFHSPMGIALYKRPRDGAIFACVTRKSGPKSGYVWQYRLEDNGHGGVRGVKVRELGNFSGDGEIEAIAVDDELGYIYYADENFGIHKWHADPEHPDAKKELAVFGKKGYTGDREGIAIYSKPGGKGYIVCTDQIEKNSTVYIYNRGGEPGNPHDHSRIVKTIKTTNADDTDGIETTSRPVGGKYPNGMLVMMNSGPKNFLFFDWRTLGVR
ncbi:MAG: phytase [Fibrella sp.]|nr:phytase [Armatimonadota bacterium]